MDLAETMKNIVAKGMQTEMGPPGGGSGYSATPSSAGYVTEKMYMLLQAYLQNKGWNPSIELLQCFSEFKDASMMPSAAYLQMMASRVALDSQGRLVLRENGKIILPYEHFANAVMLKHMNGPHGLHLGLEGTVRAVMESYTIGRECFGMEKEFIIEVVQNCPNPACRYYKNQLELTQKMGHMAPTYIQENEATASLLRTGFPHSTDFQSLSSANPNTHMGGGSAADLSEMRSAGNQMNLQRPPSRPSLNIPHRPVSQEKKVPSGNLQGLGNANKDLLALHNGAWPLESEKGSRSSSSNSEGGQEKIVRAFAEVMKNMARMKACVRPAMCKPYGKQSEALQKTLVDTIQLVQSLRSFLPPPHIPVSSWKNEDKHRLDHTGTPYLSTLKASGMEELCEQRKLD
ncbi:PREDICTED: uncharacterized protein LOC108753570 isoform X3 [Trachymyrmex septentrionalis]|uniref:uncharacterized protein isoform X3 n=1 Tax=Mycetomoellerius zeteki TaxID=64791 RepID=UPI00084E83B0|nr:PREDICTED: uncharacterized protein LOC108727559 isoform X3 [Trachymyrmex zeteki]XP_018350767.1 PREDICTED: uncharacterized protein LOC108753570 isoform X3 [Trachymyrmex septentrionalis]